MGNCCSVQGAVDHWVYVKTGDRKGVGSDADLKVILSDSANHKSSEIPLKCSFSADFQRGKTDVFQAPGLQEFGDITHIEFWREKDDEEADWYCEVVVVNDRRTDKCFYFPIQRWVKPNRRYKIQEFDTMLPQFDPNRDERQKELEEKRLLFTFGQTAPDLPVQVCHSIPLALGHSCFTSSSLLCNHTDSVTLSLLLHRSAPFLGMIGVYMAHGQ